MTVESTKVSWWNKILRYLNTINHVFIGVVTIYLTYLASRMGFDIPRVRHYWLCAIGYQLLLSEAIMSLYKNNSWSNAHGRRTKSNIHWVLNALGAGMILAGIIQAIVIHQTYHFSSLHGRLGLVSLIFTFIGMLNGTGALWSQKISHIVPPINIKLGHTVIGIIAFVLGMSALAYGLESGPIPFNTSWEIIRTMQVLSGISIGLTLIGAFSSLFRLLGNRFPEVSEQITDRLSQAKLYNNHES